MKKRGQSLVEYILLLSVISVLGLKMIKSDTFKNLMGDETFSNFRKSIEFSYKHGFSKFQPYQKEPLDNYNNYNSSSHPSYSQDGGGDSRIFLVIEPYGRE